MTAADRPTSRADCGCDLSVGPNALHLVDGHPDPRPSVTDNARAVREAAMDLYRALRRANPDAWAEIDEVEDWAYWEDIVRTAQLTSAAGRAEMTTATTEDAVQVIHQALQGRWVSVLRVLQEDDDYPAMLRHVVRRLAGAGLLATARTRPTREELAEAIMDSDTIPCDVCDDSRCHYCRSDALRKADAVLALLADQPTEAEAGARALEQAAEWLRSDMDEPWGDRAANRLDVRAARIRAGGA